MNTISTKFGTLNLDDETIEVDDKTWSGNMRRLPLLTALGALTAVAFLYSADWSEEFELSVFWAGLLLLNLILTLFLSRLSFDQTISTSDVKSINYRAPFGNGYIDIKLSNGRIRRVAGLRPHDSRIEAYIAANFPA